MDSQLRLDVGDLKLGGRRFAPADSLLDALVRKVHCVEAVTNPRKLSKRGEDKGALDGA